MPLENLIDKNNPNLKEITSIKEIPRGGNFLLTVAAPWCGHCQTFHKDVLNPVCKELKNTKCLDVDGTKEEGQNILNQIGYHPKGFPSSLLCKVNAKKETECAPLEGAYPKEPFKQALDKVGLN